MTDFPPMKPEATLSINYIDCATQIELTHGHLLLPAPDGIYMKGRVDPVIQGGRTYYTRNALGELQPMPDLNGVKENVFDDQGVLVIPKTYLLKPNNFISNTPFIPYRGAKIVEQQVNEHLDSFVQYKRWDVNHKDPRELLQAHFDMSLIGEAKIVEEHFVDLEDKARVELSKDDPFDKVEQDIGEIFWDRLVLEVKRFLGTKDWYIYDVRLVGEWLTIDRFIDWRAWQWEKEHGEYAPTPNDE